jgi:hypothetical protein
VHEVEKANDTEDLLGRGKSKPGCVAWELYWHKRPKLWSITRDLQIKGLFFLINFFLYQEGCKAGRENLKQRKSLQSKL